MKRADLIEAVESAGHDAELIATDLDRIVAAVSNPSVTRIAVGLWAAYDEPDEPCYCPAMLAFGPQSGARSMAVQSRFSTFARSFDARMPIQRGVLAVEDA